MGGGEEGRGDSATQFGREVDWQLLNEKMKIAVIYSHGCKSAGSDLELDIYVPIKLAESDHQISLGSPNFLSALRSLHY